MELSLDTCVLWGKCDPNDNHSDKCQSFFSDYPLEEHDFYIFPEVDRELDGKKRKRRQELLDEGEKEQADLFRKIELRLKVVRKKIKTEYNEEVNQFDDIKEAIFDFIGEESDAKIAASAMIWSRDPILDKPIFVSLDYSHIIEHRQGIRKEAELAVSWESIPLLIRTVKELCN